MAEKTTSKSKNKKTNVKKSSIKSTSTKAPKTTAEAVAKNKAEAAKLTSAKAVAPVKVDKPRGKKIDLRKLHMGFGILLLIQAAAVVILGTAAKIPVTARYLGLDPLAGEATGEHVYGTAIRHLYDKPLAWVVAASLLVLGVTFLLTATRFRKKFEADLALGVNKIKYIGWALSGGIMLSVVAMLSGLNDIATIALLVGSLFVGCYASASMEVLGAGRPGLNRALCNIAAVGVALPWVALGSVLVGSWLFDGDVPAYLYAAYGTGIALAVTAGVVQAKRVKGSGKFADATYSEQVLLVLAFVTASAVAWQVFAGALQP